MGSPAGGPVTALKEPLGGSKVIGVPGDTAPLGPLSSGVFLRALSTYFVSTMVVPRAALSLEASSTEASSRVESAAAGAAYASSPEFAAPKVAVETPSDEEFAMAPRGEF
jgi:hypothetical protein